jgi:hypothetical protein
MDKALFNDDDTIGNGVKVLVSTGICIIAGKAIYDLFSSDKKD